LFTVSTSSTLLRLVTLLQIK